MTETFQADEKTLFSFFSDLRARRTAFQRTYADFAPHLAPCFNVFNFLRPSETQLSELLASLLSPSHSHAQGDLFLRLFLAHIRAEHRLEPNRNKPVKVECETPTDKIANRARRIDVEINLGTFGVAIENKPWAGDQSRQLFDYGEHMQAKYGANQWCLVYLTMDGTEPTSASLPTATRASWLEGGQYVELSYGSIVQWLTECEAQCRADHVRHFLRDFIAYCNSQFLGTNSSMDSNYVRKFALQPENLELALVLAKEVTKIKEELFSTFVTDLRAALTTSFPGWRIHVPEKYGYWSTRDDPIKVFNPDWQKYRLAIEFASNKAVSLYWGVKKRKRELPDLPLVHELAKKLPEYEGRTSAWWPWYCDAKPPCQNWDTSTKVWPAIQDGSLVNMIVGDLVNLRAVVEPIINAAEGMP